MDTLFRDGLVAFLDSMGWIAILPDEQRLSLLNEVRSLLTSNEDMHWTEASYSRHMSAQSWFIVGTLPMIIFGGLHLLLVLADEMRPRFLTPVDESLRPRLEITTIRFRLLFPGGGRSAESMWRAWLGFNVSHGLGLLTTGVVLLSLALHDFSIIHDVPVIQPLSIAVTACYLAASLRYWFYAPSLIFVISLTGFVLSAIRS